MPCRCARCANLRGMQSIITQRTSSLTSHNINSCATMSSHRHGHAREIVTLSFGPLANHSAAQFFASQFAQTQSIRRADELRAQEGELQVDSLSKDDRRMIQRASQAVADHSVLFRTVNDSNIEDESRRRAQSHLVPRWVSVQRHIGIAESSSTHASAVASAQRDIDAWQLKMSHSLTQTEATQSIVGSSASAPSFDTLRPADLPYPVSSHTLLQMPSDHNFSSGALDRSLADYSSGLRMTCSHTGASFVRDELIDTDLRHFAEECDSLQGFVVLVDATIGAWPAVAEQTLTELRNAYGSKVSVVCITLHSEAAIGRSTRTQSGMLHSTRTQQHLERTNAMLSVARLAPLSSMMVPLVLPCQPPPLTQEQVTVSETWLAQWRESARIAAQLIDAITLSSRSLSVQRYVSLSQLSANMRCVNGSGNESGGAVCCVSAMLPIEPQSIAIQQLKAQMAHGSHSQWRSQPAKQDPARMKVRLPNGSIVDTTQPLYRMQGMRNFSLFCRDDESDSNGVDNPISRRLARAKRRAARRKLAHMTDESSDEDDNDDTDLLHDDLDDECNGHARQTNDTLFSQCVTLCGLDVDASTQQQQQQQQYQQKSRFDSQSALAELLQEQQMCEQRIVTTFDHSLPVKSDLSVSSSYDSASILCELHTCSDQALDYCEWASQLLPNATSNAGPGGSEDSGVSQRMQLNFAKSGSSDTGEQWQQDDWLAASQFMTDMAYAHKVQRRI